MKSSPLRHTNESLHRQAIVHMVVGVLLWLAAFTLYYFLERQLDAYGTFGRNDVLFDADPNKRIEGISHGWGGLGNRGMWHPIFSYVFSLPIRASAHVASLLGVADNAREFERMIGMLVVPSFGAGTVVLFFHMGVLGGLGPIGAVGTAVLGGASFSQLLFGSIPDHFAVTGFALALSYTLALATVRGMTPASKVWLLWIPAGVLAVGITITNAVSFAIVFASANMFVTRSWKETWRRSIRLAIPLGVFVVAITVIGAVAYDELSSLWTPRETSEFVEKYWNATPWSRFINDAIFALGNTMAPPSPLVSIAEDYSTGETVRKLTFEDTKGVIAAILTMLFVVTGTFGWTKGDGRTRALVLASAGVLGFNLVMHAFFGREYFVYSQHWLTSLIFLLAGNFMYTGRWKLGVQLVTGAAIALMIANNIARLNEVFNAMIGPL